MGYHAKLKRYKKRRDITKHRLVPNRETCVVCHEPMSDEDFDSQNAVAAGPKDNLAFAHAWHFFTKDGQPKDYEKNIRLLAAAVALRTAMLE